MLVGVVVGLLLIAILFFSFYSSPITLFSTSSTTSSLNNGFNLTVYISDVKPEIGDEVEIKIVLSNIDHPNATTVCCGDMKINIANEDGERVYGLLIWGGCPTAPLAQWRVEPGSQMTHTLTWKVQKQHHSTEIQPGRHYLTVSDCFIDLDMHEHFEISIEPIEIYVRGIF